MEKDKYKETFETWDKVAVLYQEKFMHLDLYNETYNFLCDALPNGHSFILEIGCGPGNITKYLLSKMPNLSILATDVSPNMIALAKRNNPTANFAEIDARNIDQINTKFDAIVCGFCLPYLSPIDAKKLLHDACNMLHKKGLLYISFVAGSAEKSGYQKGSSGYRTYFYFHDLRKLHKILNAHNFEIIKSFEISYEKLDNEMDIHSVIIAMKT